MNEDPIRDYLAEVAKQLGRLARRRRLLAEAEDHLREAAARIEADGASPHQAAVEAVEQFGSPQLIVRQFSGPRLKLRVGAIGGSLAAAVTIAILATPSTSHATIPVTASNHLVPRVMRYPPGGQRPQTGMPIPASTRIDGSAPVSTYGTYVFITYVWHGWQCDSDYLALPASLTPQPQQRSAGSSCRRPSSPHPAIDLQIEAGSGQPFILSGTVPEAADQLAITSATGRTHIFTLPHVALHSDPLRQAVILDLTAVHIRSVARLTLLADGHAIASQKQGNA